MNDLSERTIKTEHIFSGKVVSLQVDEVELPNGKTSQREIVKHPGAVAVIAVTPEKKMVLVEQFRKALERVLVEIPAGKLEKGEDPYDTAMRELEEETGYACKNLEFVASFYTSPGFCNEIVHVYAAKDLYKKENPAATDEDEFVNVMEVSLDEALQLMAEKKIYDAKTVFAVQYLQLQEAISG
mgnify:CR=1 FL=1